MKDLKLIQLLRGLTRRERKQLDDYMQSPFFYKRRECVALHEYIKPFAPDYSDAKLQRETAFAAVFAGEPYNAHRLLRAASELARDVENCLAHGHFQQNEAKKRELLAEYYFENNNFDYLEATVNEWARQTAQTATRDLTYYKQQAAIWNFRRKSNDTKEQHTAAAAELDRHIDIIFVIEKLRFYEQKLSNAQVLNKAVDSSLVEPVLVYIAQKPEVLDLPIVKLHDLLVQLLSQNTVSQFTELLAFLRKNKAVLPNEDLRQAYLLAENSCAIQLRQGNPAYWQLTFDLYEQEIENGILYNPDGSLRISVFKNVITVALRLAKYEWAVQFLTENKRRLPPAERDEVCEYNLANIYFHQSEYEKTLDLLNAMQYVDDFYKIAARVLRLKTYYILQGQKPFYADLLESELAAFKVFIYRNQALNKDYKEQYRNFMLFLEKIHKLQPKDAKKRAALREKLQKTRVVAEKAWLLSCIIQK